jgi:hypothetical protein
MEARPYFFFARLFAFVARVLAELTLRMARSCRLDVRFCRPVLFLVDLREGWPVCESSRAAPPLLAARFDTLRVAVPPVPTFRSLALTPGSAVSTISSRLGRGGRLVLGGFAVRP